MRQTKPYEKAIFEIIKEYDGRFYYSAISREAEEEDFKISVEKPRKEMVGQARVTLPDGSSIDYEVYYNRIVCLKGNYTLLIPGAKNG